MTTMQIVLVVLIVVVALGVAALLLAQHRRRTRQQEQFGPEYDRAVEAGDRREAERELRERTQRREKLDIRPLPARERAAFAKRWRATQADFVDQPSLAIQSADLLVAEVMSRRGYPVGDFDQQVRDVSVDHGHVVEEYRLAHDISERSDRNEASTEDLRQAMVHYRALFADLLDEGDDGDDGEHRTIDLTDREARRETPRRA
jgi:hypothetical protein